MSVDTCGCLMGAVGQQCRYGCDQSEHQAEQKCQEEFWCAGGFLLVDSDGKCESIDEHLSGHLAKHNAG